jgi:hypothetical protein
MKPSEAPFVELESGIGVEQEDTEEAENKRMGLFPRRTHPSLDRSCLRTSAEESKALGLCVLCFLLFHSAAFLRL